MAKTRMVSANNTEKMSEIQAEKLTKSMANNHFMQPFNIWKKGKKLLILDGHHRERIMRIMEENDYYGLFDGDKQIGFQCFANYVPFKKDHKKKIYHSNRTVIHPDYQGFNLGGQIIDITSRIMKKKGYKIMAKFSNVAIHKALSKNKNWRFIRESLNTEKSLRSPGGKMERSNNLRSPGGKMERSNKKNRLAGFRVYVKTYHYIFVGKV